MNPEDLLQELRMARAARIAGASIEAINQRIAERTGHPDLPSLARAAYAPPEHEARQEAALARTAGLSPAAMAGRAALQGATFGFAPELAGLGAALVPGGRGYREAAAASEQRIADLREVEPTATLLSELAGAVAVPALGAKALTPRLGRVGAGAVSGAVGAGLFGAGESEGGPVERLKGAGRAGLFGAGVGAVIPAGAALGERLYRAFVPRAANPAATRVLARSGVTPETVQRLVPGDVPADISGRARATAVQAVRATERGLPEERVRALQFRADEGVKRALRETAEAVYTPLEQNPPVRAWAFPLQNGRVRDAVRFVAPHVSRTGAMKAHLSVREVQSIVTELKDGVRKARGRPAQHKDAVDALVAFQDAAENTVPGLREANRTYAERVAQTDRWQETWNAIRQANPNLLQREYPSPGFGIRQLLARMLIGGEGRKMEAAEIVAEVMLEEGPKALERLRKLHPTWYQRAINELSSAAAGATAGTVVGRQSSLFGGS